MRFRIKTQARQGRCSRRETQTRRFRVSLRGEFWKWQRANDVWPNSTATANHRRMNRFKCFARTTAVLINFRSPAAGSMANGAITSPAAPLRRPWSAGACPGPPAARFEPGRCAIMQRKPSAFLRIRTPTERTAPESVVELRTPMFTARCRSGGYAAHHIQHGSSRPWQTTGDKR